MRLPIRLLQKTVENTKSIISGESARTTELILNNSVFIEQIPL